MATKIEYGPIAALVGVVAVTAATHMLSSGDNPPIKSRQPICPIGTAYVARVSMCIPGAVEPRWVWK